MSDTHYIEWDAAGYRTARAICGAYVRRDSHRNAPTCEACIVALEQRGPEMTAEEAFGPSEHAPVAVEQFNPTARLPAARRAMSRHTPGPFNARVNAAIAKAEGSQS